MRVRVVIGILSVYGGFFYLPDEGQPDCLQFIGFMHKTVISIYVWVFVSTCFHFSRVNIPIAGPCR